jgi:hypothetical protein
LVDSDVHTAVVEGPGSLSTIFFMTEGCFNVRLGLAG